MAYLAALAHDAAGGDAGAERELGGYCAAAGVSAEDVLRELHTGASGCPEDALPDDAFPVSTAVLKAFRKSDAYTHIVEDKLRLGTDAMMELGNLYTAALPAWLAAGLDDAASSDVELDGRDLLVLGYGSGDAAEAIPARVVPGWRDAARAIRIHDALAGATDLDRAEYAMLHDSGTLDGAATPALSGVVIDHIGTHDEPAFQDFGIAYYRYRGRP
jgi:hydroxymethylglutaryl-CoA synthase